MILEYSCTQEHTKFTSKIKKCLHQIKKKLTADTDILPMRQISANPMLRSDISVTPYFLERNIKNKMVPSKCMPKITCPPF
jgi:hypothetical protein